MICELQMVIGHTTLSTDTLTFYWPQKIPPCYCTNRPHIHCHLSTVLNHTHTVVISTRDSIPLYKLMIQLQRKHLADTEESMSQNNQILHRATCIHMQNQACSIQITESVYSQPSHTCTQSWYIHRIPCGPPPPNLWSCSSWPCGAWPETW